MTDFDSVPNTDQGDLQLEVLPLFPLANVVLFPQIKVPLYIFEPRYRQMIEAALDSSGRIGMVTAVPAQLDQMAGDPDIFPIGCAGQIESCTRRPDGTYDIALAGVDRFRVECELERPDGQLFRRARTAILVDDLIESDADVVRDLRARVHDRYGELLARVAPQYLERLRAHDFSKISDCVYANTISVSLEVDAIEKQSLLEASSTLIRLERLLAVIDFMLAGPPPGGPGSAVSLQ